jgi:cell division protein FtsX
MAEKKDLSKMSATKLREMALKIPGIDGVHAMKKEQLVEAIKAAQGTEPEKPKKTKSDFDMSAIKKQIRMLKTERDEVISSRERAKLKDIRKKIKRLKRLTRKAS